MDTDGQNMTEGEQVEPMPSSDQPAEQPVDQQETELQLPEEASDRTKQEFEKLKARNKEMAEELAKYKTQPQPQYSSVLDELYPKTQDFVPQSEVKSDETNQSLFDKDGYVEPDLLNKTVREAQERARKAEAEAKAAREKVEKFEETQIVAKVHEKYPQLDPYNPNYDSRFYEMVKNEMIGQLMKGEQDYAGAAAKVANLLGQSQSQARAEQAKAEEKQKVISQREQASTTVSAGKSLQSEDSLVAGTLKGDSLSIGERLQRSGY